MAVAGGGVQYSSALDCVAKLSAQEGPAALWKVRLLLGQWILLQGSRCFLLLSFWMPGRLGFVEMDAGSLPGGGRCAPNAPNSEPPERRLGIYV
jgi:hypothetical protein